MNEKKVLLFNSRRSIRLIIKGIISIFIISIIVLFLPIDKTWIAPMISATAILFVLWIYYSIRYEPKIIEVEGNTIYITFLSKRISKQPILSIGRYDIRYRKPNDKLIQLFDENDTLLVNIRKDYMQSDDWEYFIGLYPGLLSEGDYLKQVEQLILFFDKKISEVKTPAHIKAINYTEENLKKVESIIFQKELDALERIPNTETKTWEDLTLIKFHDQNDKLHIATIYDNDELWNDPRILKIYPI